MACPSTVSGPAVASGAGGLVPIQFLTDQLALSHPDVGHIMPPRFFGPCDGPGYRLTMKRNFDVLEIT